MSEIAGWFVGVKLTSQLFSIVTISQKYYNKMEGVMRNVTAISN